MKRLVCYLVVILLAISSIAQAEEYIVLEQGAKGDEVKVVQERLNELGFSVGTADGDYGNKTRNAIAGFQVCNNMEITGVADSKTQALLFSDNAIGNQLSTDNNALIEVLTNQLGEAITDIKSSSSDESVSLIFGDTSNIIWLQLGKDCYFWDDRSTALTSQFMCSTFMYSLLYQYSSVYRFEYINNHAERSAGYKNVQNVNDWNGSPFDSVYGDGEIIDFLMFIAEDVGSDENIQTSIKESSEPTATLKPVPTATRKPATPKPTATSTKKSSYSQAECQDIAIAYMKNHLQSHLKNPSSLIINDVTAVPAENNQYLFLFTISAMNSMGGYSSELYACYVNYLTGQVTQGGMI